MNDGDTLHGTHRGRERDRETDKERANDGDTLHGTQTRAPKYMPVALSPHTRHTQSVSVGNTELLSSLPSPAGQPSSLATTMSMHSDKSSSMLSSKFIT